LTDRERAAQPGAALDVVVIGGANTDFLVRGKVLPLPGSTSEGEEFQEAAGGKGANQAVAAARLGAAVAFVGRVGTDARGASIVAKLKEEGIDVGEVAFDATAATGIALVMVGAEGEKQIMTAPGANRCLSGSDITRSAPLISRSRVLLVQLEVPTPAIAEAVRLAKDCGTKVVLDPAPPHELEPELLGQVDIIRPNAAEAEVLTGIRVEDEHTARKAAQQLLAQGVGAAVVGAPGGNLLLGPSGEFWLPHLDVEAVDATGAGDAFAAALSVRVARGDDLLLSTRFASAAAALKTTKLGAQAGLPRQDEVEQLLPQSIALERSRH
jgi:ribokinase